MGMMHGMWDSRLIERWKKRLGIVAAVYMTRGGDLGQDDKAPEIRVCVQRRGNTYRRALHSGGTSVGGRLLILRIRIVDRARYSYTTARYEDFTRPCP